MAQLYGDGIHDDFPAIQEMIDSGVCEVLLPPPERFYLISQTLTLPSNFRLVLPRFAEIRLADGANCMMLSGKMKEKKTACTTLDEHFYYYCYDYSADPADAVCNVEITGGIWNGNNKNQLPNHIQSGAAEPREYIGVAMLFYNMRNLKLSDLSIKDPTNYAMMLDRVSYFTVENITFDFNDGNPAPTNMDGVHLNGNCSFGAIRNLKGACYDDMVALNAEEGSNGPITDILIDGLYAEDCHSAVRFLTVTNPVERIRVTNVYGTYYQYAIGFTKYYPGELSGWFDAITLDNLCMAKSDGYEKFWPWHRLSNRKKVYPLVWIQEGTHVKTLKVDSFHRRENHVPIDTVYVGKGAFADNLLFDNVTTENGTGTEMPFLGNYGTIGTLTMGTVHTDGDPILVNEGEIGEMKQKNSDFAAN